MTIVNLLEVVGIARGENRVSLLRIVVVLVDDSDRLFPRADKVQLILDRSFCRWEADKVVLNWEYLLRGTVLVVVYDRCTVSGVPGSWQ